MIKIRMKRERDREKAARMERLEAMRTQWEVRNICTSIIGELVEGMEHFMVEGWRKKVEEHLLALGLDGERYARITKYQGHGGGGGEVAVGDWGQDDGGQECPMQHEGSERSDGKELHE